MVSELETYLDQLTSIRQDAGGLMSGLSDEQFMWRPDPGRWSMSECFDHLNITAERNFIPGIDGAIADARKRGLTSAGPFVYPALQQLFLRVSEPPPKVRFKAPAAAKPKHPRPLSVVRDEFMAWQDRIAERIHQAEGLDLRKARHPTPLRVWRWSLGTYLGVTLAHERRHIWQARQVRNTAGFPPAQQGVG
ncbi:MAG: DinB family protein [Vicinamibacterales bacterium]|nr:DinB family protein [Vicinamibacterales bacterium]